MQIIKTLEAIEKACDKLEKTMQREMQLQIDGKPRYRQVWSKANESYVRLASEHRTMLQSLWNEGIFV